MEAKCCSKCSLTKPISEFYFRRDTNKYRNECKLCCGKLSKERRTRRGYKSKSRKKEFYKRNCRFCDNEFITKNDREWYCCDKCRSKNQKIINRRKHDKYINANKEKYKKAKKRYDKKYYEKVKNTKHYRKITRICSKKYRENNREKISIIKHKRRSMEKQTDITVEWLKQLKENTNGICKICECEMTEENHHPNQYNLDHIIPISKGGKHIKNNVRYICRTCNMKKSANLTPF